MSDALMEAISKPDNIAEITEKLKQGVKDLFDSDKFKNYLQTMAKFHNYSVRNTMLIHLQAPGATKVAGFHTWINNFERRVKKGEKGIRIFAPIVSKTKKEMEKLDPDTKAPLIGTDGKPITEEVEISIPRFKIVPVFDIAQTDGKPLPELAEDLVGDVRQYEAFMDALRAVSPLPIEFKKMAEDGVCIYGKGIEIREGMSEIQTVSAVIHEITHAVLHDKNLAINKGENAKPKDGMTKEVEAEGVSYVVCQKYGIETGANSLGYVAEWSSGRELKELNASLETIRHTAATLITEIDQRFKEILKERGIDLAEKTTETESPSQAAPKMSAESERSELEQYASDFVDFMMEYNKAEGLRPFCRNPNEEKTLIVEDVQKGQTQDDRNLLKSISRKEAYREQAQALLQRLEGLDGFIRETSITTEAPTHETAPSIAADQTQAEPSVTEPEKSATISEADKFIDSIGGIENLFGKPTPPPKERTNTIEHKNYQKFAEMFPQFLSGEYSHLRLEAGEAMEPLSLEWIGDNTISVMHTYTMNGELMYDPMVTFTIDGAAKTMTALEFEQSAPPMYQRVEEKNGDGLSVDGNGNQVTIRGLQASINKFGAQWFDNISTQDYLPVRGKMEIDGEDIRVTFDQDGNPIMPDELDKATQTVEPANETIDAIDRSGDKFYVDKESQTVTWVYFNPDSEAGGQYVHNKFDYSVIEEAMKETETAEDFFDYIGSVCKQELTDIDTEDFIQVDKDFKDDPYDFDDCSPETMEALKSLAEETQSIETAVSERSSETPVIAETEHETATDYPMPDSTVGLLNMYKYGYMASDMLPLSRDRGLELFNQNLTIYMLYEDNTEAMVFDSGEFMTSGAGMYGIERTEWEATPEYEQIKTAAEKSEGSREAELLYEEGNRFGIYQIKKGDEYRDVRFASTKDLEALALDISRSNYELVYTAPFSERIEFLTDRYPVLNKIYETFNIAHPEDFTGHSLSVSDVVVLKYNDGFSSHFVDDVGFVEIDAFLGNEKAIAPEQTNNQPAQEKSAQEAPNALDKASPTIAELEAQVKQGKTISVMDLANAVNREKPPQSSKARPSLIGRLNDKKALVQGKESRKNEQKRGLEV